MRCSLAVSCKGGRARRLEREMQIVRIFVSSPGDVAPERGRVQAIAAKLNREYALGGALLQSRPQLSEEFRKTAELLERRVI
jgi:hypothetical protein